MNKPIISTGISLCLILSALAGIAKNYDNAGYVKTIKSIDSSYQKGVDEYLRKGNVQTLKESLNMCMEALKTNGECYELLWRSARAAGQYAESCSALYKEGWEEICRQWGNAGTSLAIKAQSIEPQRVEAYYWQTVCTGKRAMVASTYEILKENILGKLKSSMENAYEKDKSYMDYQPVLNFVQFYINLPWPFNDYEKALKYYIEFKQNQKTMKENRVVCVLCAKFLVGLDDEKYMKEAAELLNIAMKDESLPFLYRDMACELSKKIKD